VTTLQGTCACGAEVTITIGSAVISAPHRCICGREVVLRHRCESTIYEDPIYCSICGRVLPEFVEYMTDDEPRPPVQPRQEPGAKRKGPAGRPVKLRKSLFRKPDDMERCACGWVGYSVNSHRGIGRAWAKKNDTDWVDGDHWKIPPLPQRVAAQ
jgi:hypothetical protein